MENENEIENDLCWAAGDIIAAISLFSVLLLLGKNFEKSFNYKRYWSDRDYQ